MKNTLKPAQLVIRPAYLRDIPSIDGKHFLEKPADPADDLIVDAIDIFPINRNQKYKAPMPKFNWPRGSEIHQQFDKDLAKIQERQAHTTRPLDELAVELLKQEEESEVDFPGFIHHIRSQLAISARMIQDMRMENYTRAIKAKQESKSKNNIPVAYQGTLSKAQAKNINSFKPLTTITPVDPLNIPEIRLEVGQYLTRQDWLSCSLVCKDWNETFSGFIYSTVCISEQQNPSLNTLSNKRGLIKSFSITTESLDISFYTLFMPNLRSLAFKVDNRDIAATRGFIALMNNCKEIRKLNLSITAKFDNSAFWKAVSDLPHLEELTIPVYGVMHQESKDKDLDLSKELQGLWNACSRLKRLEIYNLYYYSEDIGLDRFDWDKPGLATPSRISNKTFPYLRHLTFYRGSEARAVSQVMLITRCPNLEVLKWEVDYYSFQDITIPIGNLCRYFEEGNSPNLKSLKFSQDQEKDNTVANVLRSLDGRALQELDLSNTDFGIRAHEELKRFFPTLRVLNLSRCHFLLSSNALEIILSCPLLEDLAVYQIHAEDLNPARGWPCHRTLRNFSASFNLALKSGSGRRTKKSMTTKKELCERVYSTLAHLIQLEYLNIDQEYRDVEREDDFIPLEIELSKGFGKLAGLKKLEYFQMGAIASSVKPRELYWMLANWPKSDFSIGYPSRNNVFKRILGARAFSNDI